MSIGDSLKHTAEDLKGKAEEAIGKGKGDDRHDEQQRAETEPEAANAENTGENPAS